MKYLFALGIALTCTLASASFGALAATGPTIVMADQAKYGPAPKGYPDGATMAVLSGDPNSAGSQYTVRLKLRDGVKIPPHMHGDTENVTIISGTLLVGVGKSFDESKMLALSTGSYASIPSGTPHFAKAKGETIVQINGVGAASISRI